MPSPVFGGEWAWLGFEGEPEPGIDYSWMEIQRDLNFCGCETTIVGCALYFSSRRVNMYLVRQKSGAEALWNTIDCIFSLFPYNPMILVVCYGRHKCHISGVTSSFIDHLVRQRRLAQDSLQGRLGIDVRPLVVVQNRTSTNVPVAASEVSSAGESEVAVITGTDFPGELAGVPILSENRIILRDSQDWSLDFDNIETVDITKVGRLYVLIEASGGRRYELGFSENSVFGESIYEGLRDVLPSRCQPTGDSV
jgi:hypothetical protein